MAVAKDNVYVSGLPPDTPEDVCKDFFAQYGTVVSMKFMPKETECTCLVKLATPEEAQWMVDSLDKQVPDGMTTQISVQFANAARKGAGPAGAARYTPYGGAGAQAANDGPRQEGTIHKDQGKFGFIMTADGQEMFVMPIACAAFGNRIPPIGTQVSFTTTMDAKSGRERADQVFPAGQEEVAEASQKGIVSKNQGKFGFIQMMDEMGNEAEMFFMPAACAAFGNQMPPIGTAVQFEVVADSKTGRPRADKVAPVGGVNFGGVANQMMMASPAAQAAMLKAEMQKAVMQNAGAGVRFQGVFMRDNGKFGFIQGEDGNEMFVMPAAFAAWGHQFPPIGTPVSYSVVVDPKTGRDRADNVREPGAQVASPAAAPQNGGFGAHAMMMMQSGGSTARQMGGMGMGAQQFSGTMERDNNGRFGFIRTDAGGEMFVMPAACAQWGHSLPPIGTRVTFSVVNDPKTNRERADDVKEEGEESAIASGQPWPMSGRGAQQQAAWGGAQAGGAGGAGPGEMLGTMERDQGKFGFIKTDSGEDIFVLPFCCPAFGNQLPMIGTRVVFSSVVDPKTGKMRADNVREASAMGAGGQQRNQAMPQRVPGKAAFQGVKSENPAGDGFESSGTMERELQNGKFGFIRMDSGDEMFVMPFGCAAFGNMLPPLGTRVTFNVVPDPKTGKPRAEFVKPEEEGFGMAEATA